MTPVRRVGGLAACALVAALVLAGCKVDARVDIALRADGSGTVTARVTLDADAVRRLTRHVELADAVPLDDVRAAGWNVSGWKTSSGSATITLVHDFVGQDELARLLADLAGSSRLFADAQLTRSRSWISAKDSVAVTGNLQNLASGLQSDTALSRNLAAAGVDVDALDDQLRSQLDEAFSLTLAVHAPDGETKSVTLQAGDQERVSATSSRMHTTRALLAVIGVGLLVLALALIGASLAAMWRRRRAA